jgi:hypothetical protein
MRTDSAPTAADASGADRVATAPAARSGIDSREGTRGRRVPSHVCAHVRVSAVYPAQSTSTKYVASPAWWLLTATGTVTDPPAGEYVRPPAWTLSTVQPA